MALRLGVVVVVVLWLVVVVIVVQSSGKQFSRQTERDVEGGGEILGEMRCQLPTYT